ncbi:hypothetical protein AB0D91_46785 [Streptomyces canus]|uniref:hypothetical protein n=1 Tax=Streptomyces canus TaxID=58343 RepID=UPI0033DE4F75
MNGGLVVGGVFLVGGVCHGYLVHLLRRDPAKASRMVDTFCSVLPYSDEFCRGAVRASAATAGVVTSTGLLIVTGQFAIAHQAGTLGRVLVDAIGVSLATLLLFGALNMSLILFNFPKRLALPHMRDDLGSVIEHRRSRADRKRSAE